MKGNPKVIAALNAALKEELTAINQYFLHAEMCEAWHFTRLGKFIKKQSIDEMKHAEPARLQEIRMCADHVGQLVAARVLQHADRTVIVVPSPAAPGSNLTAPIPDVCAFPADIIMAQQADVAVAVQAADCVPAATAGMGWESPSASTAKVSPATVCGQASRSGTSARVAVASPATVTLGDRSTDNRACAGVAVASMPAGSDIHISSKEVLGMSSPMVRRRPHSRFASPRA